MTRLLLDTHVLLWAAAGSPRLTEKALALLTHPQHERLYSVVSLWEIVIKSGLQRDDFSVDAAELREGLLRNDYAELPILGPHALHAARLPALHKDPFDRLLVAQALAEGLTLVTADATVAAYSAAILRI